MKKLLNFISWVRSKTAHFIMELALYTIAFVIGFGFPIIFGWIIPLIRGHDFHSWSLAIGSTALILGKGIAIGKNKDLNRFIGKKYLNKKSFPYGKKINFNSMRKGEVVGEHEVKFSSGKEIITLNHEAFDRALYSEGALTAAKWLMKKSPGLYSMRDVLNFKWVQKMLTKSKELK